MSRRGQLVVLAAALIAVALVPMVAAYLQLGYQPAADRGVGEPAGTAERALADALDRAAAAAAEANESTSLAVRRALAPTLASIRDAGPPDAVTAVGFNDTAAERAAGTACPAGPNRRFGPCRAVGGVVVQPRGNRTHVVGVAVDVERTGANHRVAATLFVRR